MFDPSTIASPELLPKLFVSIPCYFFESNRVSPEQTHNHSRRWLDQIVKRFHTDNSIPHDVATNTVPTNAVSPDEPCLPPQLRQALADLKSAIRSVNSLQTTSRFIGIFADLSDQAIEVQLAVQSVARGTPLLEDQVARDMKKAQAAIEALSNEDRRDLQRFYAKDLLVYLEMDIPPDLETGLSKNVSRTQTTLFDIKHLHRALARVCGVEACIGDMASGLRCVQDFKRGNRAEVSRLLEQRTKAVGELHEQFLELTREERDLLWLWYGDVMVGVGIQREAGTAV